jgi:hypothetical protein
MDFAAVLEMVGRLDEVEGVTMLNVYELPEGLAHILTEVMRGRSLTVAEFGEVLSLTAVQAEQLGDLLVRKGFLQTRQQMDDGADGEAGTKFYRVQFERPKRRNMSSAVWDKLDLGG